MLNVGLLYDIEHIDAEEKAAKANSREKLKADIKELNTIRKNAGELAEEIENFIYRLKPDVPQFQEVRAPHH